MVTEYEEMEWNCDTRKLRTSQHMLGMIWPEEDISR